MLKNPFDTSCFPLTMSTFFIFLKEKYEKVKQRKLYHFFFVGIIKQTTKIRKIPYSNKSKNQIQTNNPKVPLESKCVNRHVTKLLVLQIDLHSKLYRALKSITSH